MILKGEREVQKWFPSNPNLNVERHTLLCRQVGLRVFRALETAKAKQQLGIQQPGIFRELR